MQTVLLIDVGAVFYPEWHKEPLTAARATLERVRFATIAYPLVACCVDDPRAAETSWRRAIYPEYKAHRGEKEPSLVNALASAIQMLRDDGYPVWGFEGSEADDVIASATIQLSAYAVAIGCVDKDLAQLVGKGCAMVRLDNGETIDAEGVVAKWGVLPMQMGDWLAIVGDRSDNIPGVPGIGEKGATKFLREYHHWAGICAAAENLSTEMTEKIRTSILTSRETFALSRRLVSLRYDLPIPVEEIAKVRIPTLKETSFRPMIERLERHMQNGTQIDLFQGVGQPYASTTHDQTGAPITMNQNALPPDYAQQMAQFQSQMNGAAQPQIGGAAQPGQVNPQQAPPQFTPPTPQGPQIFPPGNRQPAPEGYGYVDAHSGNVVWLASLQPIPGPQGGWQPGAPQQPQQPVAPNSQPSAAGFFAPPAAMQPPPAVATQESLSMSYTGEPLVAPPQAQPAAAFAPPPMIGAPSSPEAPKAKRGRPAKVSAAGEPVSDEDALNALATLRAYFAR